MKATTISDFRSKIKQYVDLVVNNGDAVLINRGDSAAVLISLDEYNSVKDTEALLSSQALQEELTEGILAAKSENGIVVDIDDL